LFEAVIRLRFSKSGWEMARTRAVRLSDREEEKVQQFLALNPAIDFSTLVRLALEKFTSSPEMAIRPLPPKPVHSPKKNKNILEV
jgi:hypothetical protein